MLMFSKISNKKKQIISSGLKLNLDASDSNSYPGTGSIWYDLSGNGNNLTLASGASFSATNGGIIGLLTGGQCEMVNKISLTDWTISLIIKPTALSAEPYVFHIGDGTGIANYRPLIFLNTQGGNQSYKIGIYGAGGSSIANQIFNINTWICIDITYSKSNSSLKVYANSTLLATTTFNITNSSNNYVNIGGIKNYNSDRYNGYIGNVAIYNVAISSSDIIINYDARINRFI